MSGSRVGEEAGVFELSCLSREAGVFERSCLSREAGVASGYQVGVIALLLVVVLVIGNWLKIGQNQLELQTKADAVALAGANLLVQNVGMLQARQQACDVASEMAHANGVRVVSCKVQGLEIWVEVSAFPDQGGMARAHAGVVSHLQIETQRP